MLKNLINKDFLLTKFNIFYLFLLRQKRNLKWIAIIAIAVLTILVIVHFYQKSAEEKYSAIFHQALIDEEYGDVEKSKAALKEIYETKFAPSKVKGLASFRYAGLLLFEGKQDEALKIYQELGGSGRYNKYLRELSQLLAAKILVIKIDQNSDKAAQEEGLKLIEKYESRSKILKFYISEQKGIFAMKLGNKEKAREIFEKITKEKDAKQALKMRAADMLKIL